MPRWWWASVMAMAVASGVLGTPTTTAQASTEFRDELSYATVAAFADAGWTLNDADLISADGTSITFRNDGSRGPRGHHVLRTNWKDWSLETRVQWTGGSYGSHGPTAFTGTGAREHSYTWFMDGYYPEFLLERETGKVVRKPAAAPQLNEWVTMKIEKRGNEFTLYHNDALQATYTDPDPDIEPLLEIAIWAGWQSTGRYDWIVARSLDPPPPAARLDYASVNGASLDAANPVASVYAGQAVSGTMRVAHRDPCSACILPVTGINSWDRSHFADVGRLSGDSTFQSFTWNFQFAAPSEPGTYHVALFHRGCYEARDNVYGCYPPGDGRKGVPGGGDDVWDFDYFKTWQSMLPSGDFLQGRAIRLTVQPRPTTTAPTTTTTMPPATTTTTTHATAPPPVAPPPAPPRTTTAPPTTSHVVLVELLDVRDGPRPTTLVVRIFVEARTEASYALHLYGREDLQVLNSPVTKALLPGDRVVFSFEVAPANSSVSGTFVMRYALYEGGSLREEGSLPVPVGDIAPTTTVRTVPAASGLAVPLAWTVAARLRSRRPR